MEPFSISCTTCKTRLKVRDAGAIGKLLDCPKCGAFVLVEAPAAHHSVATNGAAEPVAQYAHSNVAAQQAAPPPPPAESTFDDAASLLSDAPPLRDSTFAAAAPLAPAVSPATSSPSSIPTTASQDTVDPPPVEPPPSDGLEAGPSDLADSYPNPPSDNPVGSSLPQWVLMGGAAVAGVILALGLFLVAAWMFSGPPQQPAVATAPDGVPTEPGDNTEPSKEATDKPKTEDDNQAAEGKADPAKPTKPAKVEATKPPSETDPFAAKPGKPPKEPASPAEPATTDPPSKKPPTETDVSAEPKPAAPVDTKVVAGAINKFSRYLDDPLTPAEEDVPDDLPESPLPAEATDAAGPDSTDDPARPRPEPRKVDVAARLADRLEQIEFQNVPLAEFAQFISDLSTLPITLDPEALQFAGASPERPVSVKLKDASVGTIFKEALAPLNLVYELTPGGLVVIRPAPADGKPRALTYTVVDLTGGDAERLAALVEQVQALVSADTWAPAGPGSISAAPEKQALAVRQSEAVHFQMLLFCEKLRVARGQSPKSKFDKSLFRLEPRVSRAASKLATPITLNFSQPASLTRILDRLGKTASVKILVDWQAAAAAGWSPDAEGTVVADKLPLGDTLTALLRPMDLSYRVVDDGLIQVTTPQALESRLELEFYPVADLLADKTGGEQLVEQVKAALGEGSFPEPGPGGAIRFDAAGKCLLVSLPQPKHAELVKLLNEWRSAK